MHMVWPWKYAMLVFGIEGVNALFLPSAENDDEALQDAETSKRADPRIREVFAVYRIVVLVDEFTGPDTPALKIGVGENRKALYLQTGIPGAEKGSRESIFYLCARIKNAVREAKERGWHNMRLYQCEVIRRK
jgi:hypothetical protein